MVKHILRYSFVFFLVLSLATPGLLTAETSANAALQAQITSLLAIIAQLQAQLAAMGTTQTCIDLTRDLYFGVDDARSSGQVSILQRFLKARGFYNYPTITGYFGASTQSSVQRFQANYGIATYGTPASTGYGFVGSGTRAKIRSLTCPQPVAPAPLPAAPTPPPPQPTLPPPPSTPRQCNDGRDNDADGRVDYPTDTGCNSATDNTESSETPPPPTARQCNDTLDNDDDDLIDYPRDPGCSSLTDNSEYNEPIPPPPPPGSAECNDGSDNDNDDTVDYPRDPGCSSATDSNEDNDPLLLVLENIGNAVWNINDSEGLGGEKAYVVDGNHLNPNRSNTINLSLFENYINNLPSSFHGYVAIDIEYPFLVWLREPGGANYQQAQDQIVIAMQTAQALRPDIKWGVYGIPTTPYWLPGGHGWASAPEALRETYRGRMRAPTLVYEAVDFLSPDIYDHYPSASVPQNVTQDLAYVENIIETAVQVANGKPVFPFISHRYFNGSHTDSYSLVVPEELQSQQVETSLDSGADGVFWWGADRWFYSWAFNNPPGSSVDQDLIRANFGAEIPAGMGYSEYFTHLHEYILRYLAEEMYNIPFDPPAPFFRPGGGGGELSRWGFFSQIANVFQAFLNLFR